MVTSASYPLPTAMSMRIWYPVGNNTWISLERIPLLVRKHGLKTEEET